MYQAENEAGAPSAVAIGQETRDQGGRRSGNVCGNIHARHGLLVQVLLVPEESIEVGPLLSEELAGGVFLPGKGDRPWRTCSHSDPMTKRYTSRNIRLNFLPSSSFRACPCWSTSTSWRFLDPRKRWKGRNIRPRPESRTTVGKSRTNAIQ